MKVPEKIYVAVYPNYDLDGEHLADDWTDHPVQDCENIAYIRKDAILEWAQERLEFAKALRSDGQMVICEELIKHIESL